MCLTSQVLTLIGLLACLNLNMHHSSITPFGDILRSIRRVLIAEPEA